ncbi:hypothetical protein [Kineosporia sp. NBRC 101731]|uniref:hypothetical protein n=1 Tax=Kineosporia sp. NBRC 101731 TaxID=3032199 RepID=UPI0024A06853|nr:hypothetical protein [Kineosporia sp. NBRC 101731]GLY29487.1 hypothetical protein Kisp02_28520 [Kineosporia sp. NBRC 101731]
MAEMVQVPAPPQWRRKVEEDKASRGDAYVTPHLANPVNLSPGPASQGMLDRIGRIVQNKFGEVGPHVAVCLAGDVLYLAANSNGRAPRGNWHEFLTEKLPASYQRANALRKRKDLRKIGLLATGEYLGLQELGEPESARLTALQTALQAPLAEGKMQWVANKKDKKGDVHAEMAILGAVIAHVGGEPAEAVHDLPFGGVHRDCRLCHLGFLVFNEKHAATGYRAVTGGTHRYSYPNWRMPPWMRNDAAAAERMRELVRLELPGAIWKNGGATFVCEEEVARLQAAAELDAYESESDYEQDA